MQDEFDKSSAGNRFAGAYLTSALIPKGSFEPCCTPSTRRQRRRRSGVVEVELEHARVPHRRQAAGHLDYNVEMALQRGDLDANDVTAWADTGSCANR